jgi:hypothetical protein
MALRSNDAKSCYDRIILWVVALCLLWMGAAREAVSEMMLTILAALHFVITAFGESTTRCYRGTTHPFQGVRQGNGAAPAIWVVISVVLLSIMSLARFGLNLVTTAIVLVGFAFVDDTDLIHAAANLHMDGATPIPAM